jgi:hypothetical protein
MEAISVKPNSKSPILYNNLNKSSKAVGKAEVKQMIRSAQLKIFEPKSYDAGLAVAVGNGGTGILQKMTTIPQGDTDTTRDGDQLSVEWSQLRYNVIVNSTDVSNLIRVVLFVWHFDDGGQPPTLATIFQASNTPLSAYNRDSVKERSFTVLSDRLHAVYSGGIGHECAYEKNLKKFKITFTSGGNTGKNHIYLAAISDSAVTPFPSLNSYHRTQFFDA